MLVSDPKNFDRTLKTIFKLEQNISVQFISLSGVFFNEKS